MSRPPRPTDPQALDALYALPTPGSTGRPRWWARAWAAWRIRLHGVALAHARRLESLPVAERVAVLPRARADAGHDPAVRGASVVTKGDARS